MKKIFKISLFIFILVAITGCGKKNTILKCDLKSNLKYGTISQEMIVTFKGDNVSKIQMNYVQKLKEEYQNYIDFNSVAESLKANYSRFDGKPGVTIKSSIDNNVLNYSLIVNLSKMKKEDKEIVDLLDDEAKGYDAVKNSLEKNGFSCK